MTPPHAELGARIKVLRARLGLNQSDFAEQLNANVPGLHTTQQRVALWERGDHAPREMVMLALARMEKEAHRDAL